MKRRKTKERIDKLPSKKYSPNKSNSMEGSANVGMDTLQNNLHSGAATNDQFVDDEANAIDTEPESSEQSSNEEPPTSVEIHPDHPAVSVNEFPALWNDLKKDSATCWEKSSRACILVSYTTGI